MLKKKGLKQLFKVGAMVLLCVGVVMANAKVSSKACIKKRLGTFNSRVMVTTPLCEYTGAEVKPEVKVYYKQIELKEGVDYVVTYENNIEPGTATLTVNGTGAYKGKKSAKFIIEEKEVQEDEQEEQQLTKIDFQDNEMFAIAAVSRFLVDTMANDYLTDPNALTYVDAGMGEVFMLFPKTKDVKFTVQTVGFDEEFNIVAKDVLVQDATGAVVINSNPVEYTPNFQVVAECNGEKVVLPISYSGVDGRLIIDSECVKDITP